MKLRSVRGTHDIFGEEIDKFNFISNIVSKNANLKEYKEIFINKDVGLEFDKWNDYMLSNGKTYKNYSAAFRNWLRNDFDTDSKTIEKNFSIKGKRIYEKHHNNNTNINGFINILRQSGEHGVKKLVYASSCSVYGNAINLPISEEVRTDPLSPYASSKLMNELLGKNLSHLYPGMNIVGLRFFNLFIY